jgi:hypothetical protein
MRRRAIVLAIALAASAVVPGSGDSRAQEAPAQRPAEIRAGSCASLGQVVAPLSPLVVPSGDAQGQADATPVEQSVTDVPILLADLLSTGHIVVVQESAEASGTPAACGEIGGALASDGTLAVGMNPIEGSKLSGIASFAPTRKDDGTTVSLMLVDERANRPGRDASHENGPVGMAGEDGTIIIGANGTDASDGTSVDGKRGKEGADGQPGQDGEDGANGRAGRAADGGAGGDGGNGGNGEDGGEGGNANG